MKPYDTRRCEFDYLATDMGWPGYDETCGERVKAMVTVPDRKPYPMCLDHAEEVADRMGETAKVELEGSD